MVSMDPAFPNPDRRRLMMAAGAAMMSPQGACMQTDRRPLTPRAFGATPAADATLPLTALFEAAAREGGTVDFSERATYRVGNLTLPSGLKVSGSGVVLRAKDGGVKGNVWLTIGESVFLETLHLSVSGRDRGYAFGRIGAGCRIGRLELIADEQARQGGIVCSGHDVRIDHFLSRAVDRPLQVIGRPERPAAHFYLGHMTVTNYVRALRTDYLDDFEVGILESSGRSPHASKRAGHNGILIVGCRRGRFKECRIADAGEHAVRIGGARRKTLDINFDQIIALRSGGCALKINPTSQRLAAERLSIGLLRGVDGGDPLGGNSDLLRVSHARDVSVDRLEAAVDTRQYSCWTGVKLNDVRGLQIRSAHVEGVRHGLFLIDETSDGDPAGVYDVRIDSFRGVTASAEAAVGLEFENPTYEIGDIHLHRIDFSGPSKGFCRSTNDAPIKLAGPVSFRGVVRLPMGDGITGLSLNDPRVRIELARQP